MLTLIYESVWSLTNFSLATSTAVSGFSFVLVVSSVHFELRYSSYAYWEEQESNYNRPYISVVPFCCPHFYHDWRFHGLLLILERFCFSNLTLELFIQQLQHLPHQRLLGLQQDKARGQPNWDTPLLTAQFPSEVATPFFLRGKGFPCSIKDYNHSKQVLWLQVGNYQTSMQWIAATGLSKREHGQPHFEYEKSSHSFFLISAA